MFKCPTFENDRNDLLKFMEDKYPNFMLFNDGNKLIFLLSCENDVMNRVSKYVHTILTHRRPRFKAFVENDCAEPVQ